MKLNEKIQKKIKQKITNKTIIICLFATILVLISGFTIYKYYFEAEEVLQTKQINEISRNANPGTKIRSTYSKSIPILMYHHVRNYNNPNERMENEMSTSPADFQSEMDALKNNGYETVTPTMLLQGDIPIKPVIVSFDDGYLNNYEIAYPILKKNKQVGLFFVISGATKGVGYMTQKELLEMNKDGMEIGSHSKNHLNLTTLPSAELNTQLTDSKKDLELLTGKPINAFSYPFGQYNDAAMNATRNAGYKMAVTISPEAKNNDMMALPRINVQGWDNEKKVLKKINTFSKYNDKFSWNYDM